MGMSWKVDRVLANQSLLLTASTQVTSNIPKGLMDDLPQDANKKPNKNAKSSYERILMAPPCRLIVYQTIDERDDMSGRNPFIVSCRNVMPRQPNRWITDSF